MRLIRSTCGQIPILLSGDGPERQEEFRKIEDAYPDVLYRTSEERIGHAGGDLRAFTRGIRWATTRGLCAIAKLSHRFLIEKDYWVQDATKEMINAGAETSSQTSVIEGRHWMPLRSEAVVMDVPAWSTVVNDLPPGRIAVACESIVYGAVASRFGGRFHPWSLFGRDRMVRHPQILWHNANDMSDYSDLALRMGLELDTDFDTSGWQGRPGYMIG